MSGRKKSHEQTFSQMTPSIYMHTHTHETAHTDESYMIRSFMRKEMEITLLQTRTKGHSPFLV